MANLTAALVFRRGPTDQYRGGRIPYQIPHQHGLYTPGGTEYSVG